MLESNFDKLDNRRIYVDYSSNPNVTFASFHVDDEIKAKFGSESTYGQIKENYKYDVYSYYAEGKMKKEKMHLIVHGIAAMLSIAIVVSFFSSGVLTFNGFNQNILQFIVFYSSSIGSMIPALCSINRIINFKKFDILRYEKMCDSSFGNRNNRSDVMLSIRNVKYWIERTSNCFWLTRKIRLFDDCLIGYCYKYLSRLEKKRVTSELEQEKIYKMTYINLVPSDSIAVSITVFISSLVVQFFSAFYYWDHIVGNKVIFAVTLIIFLFFLIFTSSILSKMKFTKYCGRLEAIYYILSYTHLDLPYSRNSEYFKMHSIKIDNFVFNNGEDEYEIKKSLSNKIISNGKLNTTFNDIFIEKGTIIIFYKGNCDDFDFFQS